MPIRINFLSEHQAKEEERRRDPVKRATYGVGVALMLLLVWGGYLQLRLMGAKMSVASSEARFKQIQAQYNQARANEAVVASCNQRLMALERLASARILWGSCLDALQFAAHPDIQLVQLQTRQSYSVSPGVAAVTNETGVVTSAGRPAISRETAVVILDAKDNSVAPGDTLIREYQDRVAAQPFFQQHLGQNGKIRMTALGQLQKDMAPGSAPFVRFTLECPFAEIER